MGVRSCHRVGGFGGNLTFFSSVHLINVRAGLGTARLPREKEPRGDPAESVAIEEASQLPAGKRVVPKPALALINVTASNTIKCLNFKFSEYDKINIKRCKFSANDRNIKGNYSII
ncbi:hypothetical protein GCM10011389_09490 [Pontibacillus salipaludis]|uniref:Uncharacterized protein n=1 Tax=Pontibacillus salipaludis TaxID=1697394 RepID=A0ABQ1PUZ5_9BACI|nr:hypothetical protein GCM10011389_09490 [Pontibacillus salipaludis]